MALQAGEGATLEILVGAEVVIMDESVGPHVLAPGGEMGTSLAVARDIDGQGASGLAGRRSTVEERHFASLTARTITSQSRLDKEFAHVRRRGYATAVEELEVGFSAVAAPVRNHEARVVTSIGIGGPSSRTTRTTMGAMSESVIAAADRVSKNLGWNPSA